MNAIITAATGYSEADLQIFLNSVERNCNDTKVFMIVFRRDLKTINALKLKYPFIEPVYIDERNRIEKKIYYWLGRLLGINNKEYLSVNSFLKFIGKNQLHIIIKRYFVALQLVMSFGDSFSNVLLTDSRDVFIQKDPFGFINGNSISGIEGNTIGNCMLYNSKWVKQIYGNEIFNNLENKQIVCAGVTLGTVEQVNKYLLEMCNEIWKHLLQVDTWIGSDQAIHNYLIYYNKILLDLVDNKAGLIANLQYENPRNIVIDSKSGLVIVQGKYPAIVHQYDRHPNLMEFLSKRIK